MQFQITPSLVSLAFLFIVCATPCTAQQSTLDPSEALLTVLQQAEQAYLSPMGYDLNSAVNQAPDTLASILGVTMQRQRNYMGQHQGYAQHYEALQQEALSFLFQIAGLHNYRNPKDGSSMDDTFMEEEYFWGLRGQANQFFIQNQGVNPATIALPFMLAQVNTGDTAGRYVQEDPDTIELFGEVAPPAENGYEYPDPNAPAYQPEPTQQPQAAEPITGCSGVQFTIKQDTSTTAAVIYGPFYDLRISFSFQDNIHKHISKMTQTVNGKEFHEATRQNNTAYKRATWDGRFDLSGWNYKEWGKPRIGFIAYDEDGNALCRGEKTP